MPNSQIAMREFKFSMPDLAAKIGRAIARFLRDASDRYSDVIGEDDDRVTRDAPDVVQASLALMNLEWTVPVHFTTSA